MDLRESLSKKKNALVGKWLDLIIETYPANSQDFFKKQTNRFANPMGYNLTEGVKGLFDVIINEGCDHNKAASFLDQIIRIRAVQEFTPSEAISFVFGFKKLLRREVESQCDRQMAEELLMLESNLDDLALQAFDVYMKCRQRLFEIRINEVTTRTIGALQRANVIWQPEEETGVKENNI